MEWPFDFVIVAWHEQQIGRRHGKSQKDGTADDTLGGSEIATLAETAERFERVRPQFGSLPPRVGIRERLAELRRPAVNMS